MGENFQAMLNNAVDFVWGLPLIILLFGTHIFLTIRLGFIQRFIIPAIKISFGKDSSSKGDISHFGALTTALAATIGTGNIFGVAGAIAIGGPGAVLWMWLTGVFGIATKYGEALLSVKFRTTTPDGRVVGGPMYVLERGMNMKWLGMVFAFFTAIAAFGIGNMTQSNTISSMVERISTTSEFFPTIPAWLTGVLLAGATAAVVLGGIKSIARVCTVLVPFMALAYVAGCLVILAMNAPVIPETISVIVSSAFSGQAAAGGFVGASIMMAMRMGIQRGLFSNEAGLGSAPIVAAAARTTNPVRQALVSATGTFWDTVVICAMTGLVIVSSGEWLNTGDRVVLSELAFGQLPVWGPLILTVGLLTFVFSTILGWSYFGERAAEYLLGPNLISLIALSGIIAAETRKYLSGRDGITLLTPGE